MEEKQKQPDQHIKFEDYPFGDGNEQNWKIIDYSQLFKRKFRPYLIPKEEKEKDKFF